MNNNFKISHDELKSLRESHPDFDWDSYDKASSDTDQTTTLFYSTISPSSYWGATVNGISFIWVHIGTLRDPVEWGTACLPHVRMHVCTDPYPKMIAELVAEYEAL